jgi:hypothetical protein
MKFIEKYNKYFKETREVISEGIGYLFIFITIFLSLIGIIFIRGYPILYYFCISSLAISSFGVFSFLIKLSLIKEKWRKEK